MPSSLPSIPKHTLSRAPSLQSVLLSLPSQVLCAPRTPSEHTALSAPPYRPRLPFQTAQEGLTCPIARLPPCRSPLPRKSPALIPDSSRGVLPSPSLCGARPFHL